MLTKFYPYLLSLSVIKRIALKKTYLQFVFLILAIEHYLIKRKNIKFLAISFISIFSYMLLSISLRDSFTKEEISKWTQLFIMISTIPFIYEIFIKNIQKITYISAGLSLIEAILGKVIGYEKFANQIFSITIPRVQGIVGEPNFSALFLFTLFVLNKEKSRYWLLPFILLTGSKTTILLILIFLIVSKAPLLVKNIIRKIAIGGFILYPLISYCAFKYSNNETRAYLTKLTSHRFAIHYIYVSSSFENLFGDGMVTNVNRVHNERPQEVRDFLSSSKLDLVKGEQHSLPIEVLYKLGFLPFLIFGLYLFVNQKSLALGTTFIMLNLINLNGMSELSTFLILSMIFKDTIDEG